MKQIRAPPGKSAAADPGPTQGPSPTTVSTHRGYMLSSHATVKHLTVAALLLVGAACSDHTTMVQSEPGASGALASQGAVLHAPPGTAVDVTAPPQPTHPTAAALTSASVTAWITGPSVVRSGDWCVWQGHHDGSLGYTFDWSVSGSVNNWFPDEHHVWANSDPGYVEISLTVRDSNAQAVAYARHAVDVIYDPWGPSCPLW